MPTERSERIKQYIVIALAVTAVVVAYFRFFLMCFYLKIK